MNADRRAGWLGSVGVGIILATATLCRAITVFVGAHAVRTQRLDRFVATLVFAALSLYTDREVRRVWR